LHGGAPFRKQQIAEALLRRARHFEGDVRSLTAAIHVALLAREASYLVGSPTLTLALEALAIRYRMEVTAECSFLGNARQLAVKRRLESLEDEVRTLVGKGRNADYQRDSALMKIVDDLRGIYHSYGHFAEEQEARIRLLSYEWRARYSHSNRLRNIVCKIVGFPEAYINTAARGVGCLASLMVMWIVVFAAGYMFLVRCDEQAACNNFGPSQWLQHSAMTFFAAEQGLAGDPKFMGWSFQNGELKKEPVEPILVKAKEDYSRFWTLTVIEVSLGYVHLGLLISYIFQKIARR
jgi:hypothetical protein